MTSPAAGEEAAPRPGDRPLTSAPIPVPLSLCPVRSTHLPFREVPARQTQTEGLFQTMKVQLERAGQFGVVQLIRPADRGHGR
ncbi:hypothetical protein ACFV9E_40060, partial [Streptomyces sp. NPDC059835]|uniref:hypothetical protein n=1 Tax=Streptomyces sp. NPDC059835 TaxID=3346967 RepID=UPI00365B2A80